MTQLRNSVLRKYRAETYPGSIAVENTSDSGANAKAHMRRG